jgi:hypothetical protein
MLFATLAIIFALPDWQPPADCLSSSTEAIARRHYKHLLDIDSQLIAVAKTGTDKEIAFDAMAQVKNVDAEIKYIADIVALAVLSKEKSVKDLARRFLRSPLTLLRRYSMTMPELLRIWAAKTKVPILALELRTLLNVLGEIESDLALCLPPLDSAQSGEK